MKQKTKKAASKRFFFSANGKAQRRTIGQAHFNGLDTGNQTRKKHNDKSIHADDAGRMKRLLPYS